MDFTVGVYSRMVPLHYLSQEVLIVCFSFGSVHFNFWFGLKTYNSSSWELESFWGNKDR